MTDAPEPALATLPEPVREPAADPAIATRVDSGASAPAAGPAAEGAASADAIPRRARGRGAHIVVEKLGKAYIHGGKALPILWDVDLTLEPGDMVAVVGASGVGKSTFLQILGTLDLPTSGSIRFDGEELTTMSPSRLAEFRNRRIGFVFQFHHLLPEFTALENVMMPALIQRIAIDRGAPAARATSSAASGSRTGSPTGRASCRAASSSASRSRARWCSSRRCSWPTSRPATSTARPARRSTSCSSSSTASAARRCWSSPTTPISRRSCRAGCAWSTAVGSSRNTATAPAPARWRPSRLRLIAVPTPDAGAVP